MPNYCAVSEPHSIGKTLFGVPKDNEMKELWENALGIKLKKKVLEYVHHILKIQTS